MPGVREQKGIPSTDLFNLYILFSHTRPREGVYVMHVCILARFLKYHVLWMEKRKRTSCSCVFLDWVSRQGRVNTTERIAMLKCISLLTGLPTINCWFKTFNEPILRSVQERRADEAKDYFVLDVPIFGGDGVGPLWRHIEALTKLHVHHVLLPSSFKQNRLVQPEMFQKEKVY